jgi:L-aspartate oxidase
MVVVGSGAAGIAVALTAAERGLRVLMVTKDLVGGATPLAQGGLAAALGPGDTAAAHVSDTLVAGAGLCEPAVVTALADSAPGAIGWLTGLGARLETGDLRLEGGHSAHRIVHSGNDATGAEVHRTLLAALLSSGVEILDRTAALGLLLEDRNDGGAVTREPRSGRRVAGLAAGFIGADGRLTPGVISAGAVVIAAGGLGQAFGTTSNPAGATGDGIAIAARAGAVIRDLEFVQFHPTVLWLPGASGQCPLVTEALRGAGAVLRDLDGTPLMAGHDPRGDLAPRDVVAARMAAAIAAGDAGDAGDAGHVWLDATALGADLLENGFPTVTAACRKYGIDPVTDLIPVAPGAHYSCGGILADLDGRTSVPGLYAAGEAASTGVQGANRLASNSVTEAVIAGRRTGAAVAGALAAAAAGAPRGASGAALGDAAVADFGLDGAGGPMTGAAVPARPELAAAMSRWAGVLRDGAGLDRLVRLLDGAGSGVGEAAAVRDVGGGDLDLEAVEAANLRTVSLLIAAGARRRAESRGCHRRRDAAQTAAAPWHTLARFDGQRLVMTEEEL